MGTSACIWLTDGLTACCVCRAEEIRPLPASSRLRDSLKVRAKKLGWAPDRVGTASATSAFHEAGAAPPAPTTPEQESKGGLQVQGSDGGPQTQVGPGLAVCARVGQGPRPQVAWPVCSRCSGPANGLLLYT